MRKIVSVIFLVAGSCLFLQSVKLVACPTEKEVRNFFLRNSYVDKSSALINAIGMELQNAQGDTYKITGFEPPNSTLDYQVERDVPEGLPSTATTTTEYSCKYKLFPATLSAAGKFGAYVVFEKK